VTYDERHCSDNVPIYYNDVAQSSYCGGAHVQPSFSEAKLESKNNGLYNDCNVNSDYNGPNHKYKIGESSQINGNFPFEGFHKDSSALVNHSTNQMYSWLQHCNQQPAVLSPPSNIPQQVFKNETEKPTNYADYQHVYHSGEKLLNVPTENHSSNDFAFETGKPTSSNGHCGLQNDYIRSTVSNSTISNTSYYNYNNKSPITSNRKTGSSRGSELSRPSSVSNMSSGVLNYDSPQTDPRYSPMSYHQNRYQPYNVPSNTALHAISFTGTFFSNNNQRNSLHESIEYSKFQ